MSALLRLRRSVPFIESFPSTGPWTAFGLSRAQFFLILTVAVALFVWIDGPVWRHAHERHFARLFWSYAVIPAGVALSQTANRAFGWGRLFAATVTLGVIKLVLTAVLLAMIGMAG